MINMKEMENIFGKTAIIMKANIKMVLIMAKGYYIITMVKSNMKENF